jgi:hypothetical protein
MFPHRNIHKKIAVKWDSKSAIRRL